MKLLLTSSGLTNDAIVNALRDLTNKDFSELCVAFIPTAANVEEGDKSWLINDFRNIQRFNFANIDIVDIAALPRNMVQPRLEKANVIVVGGGNTFFLMDWITKSGLNTVFPELLQTRVYVGISAGSMVVTPSLALSRSERIVYEGIKDTSAREKGLGFVDFQIRPHLNSPYFPDVRIESLAEQAKEIKDTFYAIDDNTAIKVDNGKITVISEGKWKKFN